MPVAATSVRYRYNSKGRKVKINPSRSRLMKQVMRHLKGKKLSSSHRNKIKVGLKKTASSGRTKTGRRVIKKVSK